MFTTANLAECSKTYFDSSPVYGHGSTYHSTYHTSGSTSACGGDTLVSGEIRVRGGFLGRKTVWVNIEVNHDWNLYSVYFLPIGADPVTGKHFIGEFFTDGSAQAVKPLRDCTSTPTPDCLSNPSSNTDISSMSIFNHGAGHFLFYSRGPIKRDDDGDGVYEWNTSDETSSGNCNNPQLWERNAVTSYVGYDMLQFIDVVL